MPLAEASSWTLMPERVAMSNRVSPALTVYVSAAGSDVPSTLSVAVGDGLGTEVRVRVGVAGPGVLVSVGTGVSEGIGVMVGVGVRLGVGVNVAPQAIPLDDQALFPATCVQAWLGRPLSRPELLCAILSRLLEWRERLAEAAFLQAWEALLAFRDEWVHVFTEQGAQEPHQALVLGLDSQGRLRLRDRQGATFNLHSAELRLRPMNIDQET